KGGAEVVEVALPASFAEALSSYQVLITVEAAAYHRERLQRHPEDYPPRIRGLIEEGLGYSAPEYARRKAHQKELRRAMRPCLEGVDALLTPATTGPALDAATTGNPAFNAPWSFLGFPTVSFPAGKSAEGLPLAVQLAGGPWREGELFAVAAWC